MTAIDSEGVLKVIQLKITEPEIANYLVTNKESINNLCTVDKNFKKKLELQISIMGRSKRLIELIAQKEGLMSDRQTNWHIVPVSLPLLFNPSLENSKLRIMINQVVILLLYWVAISEGVEIQTTMNSVLIKSSIPTIELISHTEEIELTIFDDFFKQTKKLSQQIEILANFQTNPTCSTQGVAEDIGTVLHSNLTKKIIGNICISHVEQKMEKLQYIAWYNKNCFFTLNKEFRKIIQNFDTYVT